MIKQPKPIHHDTLSIGQIVVVTDHPETQVYTVAAIDGHMAILQWREGMRYCSQGHDKYSLYNPTLRQIEYSIAANGPLVSTRDLVEWA
jgi:hypothetical protein